MTQQPPVEPPAGEGEGASSDADSRAPSHAEAQDSFDSAGPEDPEGLGSPAMLAVLSEMGGERFSRAWLLGILVVVAIAFFWMLRVFVTPIIVAAVFSSLAYPLQQRLTRLLRGRRGIAALLSIGILILGVLIPFYITVNLVFVEAVRFVETSQPAVEAAIDQGEVWLVDLERWRDGLPEPLREALAPEAFTDFDWLSSARDAAGTAGNVLAGLINRTSRGTAQLIFGLFVVLFSMFYFFRDGERMLARLRYLSPLDAYYEDLLAERLISISRATLRGSIILGFIQGGIGALTLLVAGVPAAILWGIAMVVLSVIPIVGTWLVMYPIAFVQLVQGHWLSALFIFLVTAILISNIDNLLRPRLVGRGSGMHDLLVFFATLGGISVFGVMGFIVGPIIAAFFVALLDIYALEFKPQLERPPRQREDPHRPAGAASG